MFRSVARQVLPTVWRPSVHLARLVERVCAGRVYGGIFAGMLYVTESYGSVRAAKILGTYEKELSATLRELLCGPIDHVVVAGAAEGYYAVGFALQPSVHSVDAFEPTDAARTLIHQMAAANGVDEKISVGDICHVSSLKACLRKSKRSMVFMDIEGGEAILLDFDAVPALLQCVIVVEVHEFCLPGVERLLEQRAEKSHHVNRIDAVPREWQDFPIPLVGWRKAWMQGAATQSMSEGRPAGMCWFVMTPREDTVTTNRVTA